MRHAASPFARLPTTRACSSCKALNTPCLILLQRLLHAVELVQQTVASLTGGGDAAQLSSLSTIFLDEVRVRGLKAETLGPVYIMS